ncbi:N-acetylmannosamine-6-phosphate 2-epimerase [Paenibacillus spongiae]|uniref:Putative N-acetylmannosamine-6-phosphate 2-epimerase n=1 Tax=Paenibacillus spongiae TaxID=2909671 RepID=A0ABY5SDV3_9BACL|nr:N-acetylmannosamine-6-phosphate 2-epimerase [Paenibacillus spongiae]UVI31829.1 N-acetylmannosamine-6-phosphate 2-epimerase [Paenibacillus spongiae]
METALINRLKAGCIVSCQALKHEPLFGSDMMAAMAVAAEEGGAVAIRANTPKDIEVIKNRCSLPVIGLYKRIYDNSDIYITPTMTEVEQIVSAGADFVAVDATARTRPDGLALEEFIRSLRERFPSVAIVADVSTFEEGVRMMDLQADLVSTTLSGYTSYSLQQQEPDFELVRRLAGLKRVPVLAEGRIWTAGDCLRCFEAGAHAVVIGTAITRPQEITKRFVEAIRHRGEVDMNAH